MQRRASAWQSPGAVPAQAEGDEQGRPALEVRLPHTCEGRFEYLAASGSWRLVTAYEAYMDSPLFGFEAECADALLDLGL